MARPTFQIWQNKPKVNSYGQYVYVDVSDYYSVGFDTDDAGEDDIYTNFSNLGRGDESNLDQDAYFDEESINLDDHIYGVGQFRIEKIYLKLQEIAGTNVNNHNNTNIYVSFLDSAFIQCDTGNEPGCELLRDGLRPQDFIETDTGDLLKSEEDVYNAFYPTP